MMATTPVGEDHPSVWPNLRVSYRPSGLSEVAGRGRGGGRWGVGGRAVQVREGWCRQGGDLGDLGAGGAARVSHQGQVHDLGLEELE